MVPISALRPAKWNPRTISASQFRKLQDSLERDPKLLWSRPVLATTDGTIYAGSMRYKAAVALPESWRREHFGMDGIPAVLEDVSLEFAKERALRDNGSWGGWAELDLAEILAELETRGVPLETLGFEANELERLLALVIGQTQGDDDAFDPTAPSHPTTEPGDLFEFGPHRLLCANSRDPSAWERLMESLLEPGVLADAIWTDPPYGVDLAGVALPSRGVHADLVIEGDLPHAVAPLLAEVFPNCDRWLKPGAPFYITGPHGAVARAFIDAIEQVGWHLAQTLVWVKNGFVPGRADYHYQHEAVYYGWKRGAAHVWLDATDQSTVIDDEPNLSHMRREELIALVKTLRTARGTDVIREDKTRHNDLHPTMKPTGLIRTMLANSTKRGDLILEPFAGSGSTIVAAHLLGRRVAAIELEPKFCDVIIRRWTELDRANTVVRIRNGERQTLNTEAVPA